ncbi:uncharacterized protein BT62DRAFT_937830 [Guyanagaster necrorhizus]|uniref:Uncharacterized protein n=1 Tax=Guyanagaster necrorhizus TaxID=856835 RepID=A0A9P8AM70_9AGAR|nr:uncharacterized protein BT62DRAFT_937830 [Guyanagaster necrorhizus MCA 3950]KAG7440570.1 hypothetical protein BT62DRAFT_937830 [Guyanagaster necrorhizus MCA 3950]
MREKEGISGRHSISTWLDKEYTIANMEWIEKDIRQVSAGCSLSPRLRIIMDVVVSDSLYRVHLFIPAGGSTMYIIGANLLTLLLLS